MPKQTYAPEHCGSRQLNRRDLIQGGFAFLGGFPLCCATPALNVESIRFQANAIFIDLRKAPALAAVGSAVAVVHAERGLDLIIVRPGARQFVVLDRSCTHNGAQCTYNHKRRTLRCTSLNHAEYDLKGTLLHGRTHGNLRAYEARLTGSILRVALPGEHECA